MRGCDRHQPPSAGVRRWLSVTTCTIWRPISWPFLEPEQVGHVHLHAGAFQTPPSPRARVVSYGVTQGGVPRATNCGKRRVNVAQLGIMRDVNGHAIISCMWRRRVGKKVGMRRDEEPTFLANHYAAYCPGSDTPPSGAVVRGELTTVRPRHSARGAGTKDETSRSWSSRSNEGMSLECQSFVNKNPGYPPVTAILKIRRIRNPNDAPHRNRHHSRPTDSPTTTSRAAS